jgi:hypothetical protein
MTRARRSSTADYVFGTVPTEGGHGRPPNVVIGRTGSGERDPQLVGSSSCARALTRSVALTPAATATHTAEARLPLEPWPVTLRGYPAPGAGSAAQRFFTEEAHDGRVA